MSQFTVTIDDSGNMQCDGGYVIDLTTGTTEYTVIGGAQETALNYQFGIR